jgi:molecular chaperone HscB
MEPGLFLLTQMQNGLVVVDRVLPSRPCAHCGAPLEILPICSKCHLPQPVVAEGGQAEDFFSTLGVPRNFKQDLSQLERRFYQLSRLLHPDRYTTAGEKAKALSLERMSQVNQAYQTLKNPNDLRDYLLELEGIKGPKNARAESSTHSIPLEITETWFEIQELLLEAPDQARQKLVDFEAQLQELTTEKENELRVLEQSYDSQTAKAEKRETLNRILNEVEKLNYLKSIKRDSERIKKKGSAHE